LVQKRNVCKIVTKDSIVVKRLEPIERSQVFCTRTIRKKSEGITRVGQTSAITDSRLFQNYFKDFLLTKEHHRSSLLTQGHPISFSPRFIS
jgi:hypothetical protein